VDWLCAQDWSGMPAEVGAVGFLAALCVFLVGYLIGKGE
jgi:hypothetical protein